MTFTQKKPVKNKKETENQNENLENTAFKTGVFGFKRTQVNLFINSLKKQIRALEKEKENLIVESGTIDGGERHRLTEQFERQILDLSEKLNSEKNTSAMLEKECMRLQGEIENLNIKLVKKGGADISEAESTNITRAYLSSSLTRKLNNISEEINRIKNEFMIDEEELIISLPEDKSTFGGSDEFKSLSYQYSSENKNTKEEENLLITDIDSDFGNNTDDSFSSFGVIEESSENNDTFSILNNSGYHENIIEHDFDTDAFKEKNNEKIDEKEYEQNLSVTKGKEIKITEVVPSIQQYEHSENSFDEILMNSEKIEKDDDFADILFEKTKSYKSKGEDLIAVNPEAKDYGDDLIAGNPAAVDKGEDLNDELYELYSNDSNILIDDDNKFYSGEYSDEDFEDNTPDVSKLGFIGISEAAEQEETKNAYRNPRRAKNIADDMEMSSSMDISDFLL